MNDLSKRDYNGFGSDIALEHSGNKVDYRIIPTVTEMRFHEEVRYLKK